MLSPVFSQVRSRKVALDYVRALTGDARRKTCWSLAETAGHATPRTFQALLNEYSWDPDHLRERLGGFLTRHLAAGARDAGLAVEDRKSVV